MRKSSAVPGKTLLQRNIECNCRKRDSCPLRGKCLSESVVYKATVKSGQESKFYIGCTGGTFKERYYNHTKSFRNVKYEKETELSKHVWSLKKKSRQYEITWEIVRKSNTCSRKSGNCNLCLEEKLAILIARKTRSSTTSGICLNKRTELVSKCRHGYRPANRAKKK